MITCSAVFNDNLFDQEGFDDCEFVHCHEKDIFMCPVCATPHFDQMLLSCGHTFCREHGLAILEDNVCVVCQCTNIVEVPNLLGKAMVASCTVKCVQKTHLVGLDTEEQHICGWIGKFADFVEHRRRCIVRAHNYARFVLTTSNYNLVEYRDELVCNKEEMVTLNKELRECQHDLAVCREELGTCRSELATCRHDLETCREELCKDGCSVCLLKKQVHINEGAICSHSSEDFAAYRTGDRQENQTDLKAKRIRTPGRSDPLILRINRKRHC